MAEVDDIEARLQRDIQNRDQEIQARDTEIMRLKDQISTAERDFIKVCWMELDSSECQAMLIFLGYWATYRTKRWWNQKKRGTLLNSLSIIPFTWIDHLVHGWSWWNPSSA